MEVNPPPEKMIVDENTPDQSKKSVAENKATREEINNVIRIINLSDRFVEATLRDFIEEMVQPNGKVQELYIRKDDTYKVFYAYVIFELSCDAVKATRILNGHIFNTCKFDVALINPHLSLTKYATVFYRMRDTQLQEEKFRRAESRLRQRTALIMTRLRAVPKIPVARTLNTEERKETATPDNI